jgi:3-dehydroquinate dehydratase I
MICISIAGVSFERCRDVLADAEMAEIRLDRLDFSIQQVKEIFSIHPRLIATIKAACRKRGCKLIVSYHNYENTPPREELKVLVNRCFSFGADVAKIACQVNCEADAARILSLYDFDYQANVDKKIVAIGMGEKGKITRPASLLLGAPFTYASMSTGKETAPGQLTKQTLEDILDCLKNE